MDLDLITWLLVDLDLNHRSRSNLMTKNLIQKKFISQEIIDGFSKTFFCFFPKIKENKYKQ